MQDCWYCCYWFKSCSVTELLNPGGKERLHTATYCVAPTAIQSQIDYALGAALLVIVSIRLCGEVTRIFFSTPFILLRYIDVCIDAHARVHRYNSLRTASVVMQSRVYIAAESPVCNRTKLSTWRCWPCKISLIVTAASLWACLLTWHYRLDVHLYILV